MKLVILDKISNCFKTIQDRNITLLELVEKFILQLVENEDTIVKGNIDILVLHKRLWVMVIESKRQEFSLSVGVTQLLAYMLANPDSNQPTLGLLTNGGEFQFVKLTRQDTPQYAFSQSFNLRNPGNELYTLLRILKRLAQILSV